ncbi:MAG TPA: ABC transporter substrate-binding protein [Polyangiaceae bacterium]
MARCGRAGARLLGAWLAIACPSLSSGCNALVDTSTPQCNTHADCPKRGAELAQTYCTAEKICSRDLPSCTTHRDCSEQLGEPGYCRPDRLCTRVLTRECTEVVPEGALLQDDVILAGFMGPVRGPFSSHGTPLRQGAALAFDEIETLSNGIPGVDAESPRRHLALLVCHDTPDGPSTLGRPIHVARHLVETVGVPAIIGPSKIPTSVIDIVTEITTPGNVLTISPSATHPGIPKLETGQLFWRTVPSDQFQVDAWRYLVLGAVASLWESGAIPPTREPRVVYVARADSYGAGLTKLFREQIKFSSPPPTWTYDLEKKTDWDNLADEIADVRPELLFAFSTGEFATELLPRLEQRLASAERKPYYLLLDGNRVDELSAAIDENPELSARILGTAPGVRTTTLFNAFRGRFIGTFVQEPGSLAEFAYDAAYLLAYAVAGAKNQEPSGVELGAALSALSCPNGTRVVADPSEFSDGFQAAARDACVNFEGASGPLDFDNEMGEAPNLFAVWCAGRDESGKPFPSLRGLYYDPNVANPGVKGLAEDELLPFCPAAR